MRNVADQMGKNAKTIEPLVPVDLVVDHSIMIDHFGTKDALDLNMKLEFQRNRERYEFMKWGMQAFRHIRRRTAGLRHRASNQSRISGARRLQERRNLLSRHAGRHRQPYDHDQWNRSRRLGVGGIEAEAGMLGQPVYFLTPDGWGHLKGKLREGVTATDLVLTVTELLRKAKVVGKFVEFFGEGTASLAVPDRATIGNMAPEYGDDGFFSGRRENDLVFRRHRTHPDELAAFEAYFRAQGLFGIPKAGAIDYSSVVTLDLGTVAPSLAGPKRPQDRIEIGNVKREFTRLFSRPVLENGFNQPAARLGQRFAVQSNNGVRAGSGPPTPEGAPRDVVEMKSNRPLVQPVPAPERAGVSIADGDVLIAAITSCTNTSNPGVLLAAGLLAKKAVEAGLTVRKHIKTSLAPGSRIVTDYLQKTGLLPYLEKLGFSLAAYGCTTCIGNAGDLAPEINETIIENNLCVRRCCRAIGIFEARIHPNLKANFLASPPLVVAYAIAGTVLRDLMTEPLGTGTNGKDVVGRLARV